MVVIDATILLLMLRPGTSVPVGSNGLPVHSSKERIEHLVEKLGKERTKIIIPTPALSEVLVRAGAAASQQIVERIQKLSVFQVQPFDALAALEVAAMTRNAMSRGEKRKPRCDMGKAQIRPADCRDCEGLRRDNNLFG